MRASKKGDNNVTVRFISFMIEHLRHVREAICETINELGYNPIMIEEHSSSFPSRLRCVPSVILLKMDIIHVMPLDIL